MKGYVAKKGNRWYAVIYEGSIRSPAANVGAGTRPAPNALTPNGSRRDSHTTSTVATMRSGH